MRLYATDNHKVIKVICRICKVFTVYFKKSRLKMNKTRTQNMVNKMKVQRKSSYLTSLALVIYIFSDHLLLYNVVNGQISRSDYRSGFLVTNPCVSKQTCSECLQTPTCAWCMKEVR